jgi:CRP-like cAMP-binding protein
MSTSIEFKEIPLFRFFDPSARQKVTACFQKKVLTMGQVVIQNGESVAGLYLVVEGELAVCLPPDFRVIATIGRGGTVGEMSLIQEKRMASAQVSVCSPSAKLLFCGKDDFRNLIDNDHDCAFAFYKGAAVLVADRLRDTNQALQEQITSGQHLLTRILTTENVSRHLIQTKEDVEATGSNIVSKLVSAVPVLTEIKATHPELHGVLDELERQIEEVFLVESQKFDRIAQQLHLILQQYENIKRVANGFQPLQLRGDAGLFDGR